MARNAKRIQVAKGVMLRSLFGLRVKEALPEAGLTPDALAVLCELPAKRIESILAGSYVRLRMRDMENIARAINIPLYVLLSPQKRSAGFIDGD